MAALEESYLADFSIVEVSATSVCGLRLDEYSASPSPMKSAFCQLLSEEQYNQTGMAETEKALKVSKQNGI